MTASFAVNWDYRCPFARNAHEHLLTGLAAGANWDVRFVPFSLGQAHVEEGQPSVWEKPDQDTGILALQAGVVVRDIAPDRFPDVHRALFAARHDEGRHLEDPQVVRAVLTRHGVDPDPVFAQIADGSALRTVRAEHESFVKSHNTWGVPTFIVGDQAVFVRLMNRAPLGSNSASSDPASSDPTSSDPAASVRIIERLLDLLTGWTDLNEFKHTSIPR